MNRTYCVYILASRSRNLYVGVTNNVERRMLEHRQGLFRGFTTRYRIFRLAHFEFFGDIQHAIAREKEIKGWRREKKVQLIERHNPAWPDLAEHLGSENLRPEPRQPADQKRIPHRRSPRPGDRVRNDSGVLPGIRS